MEREGIRAALTTAYFHTPSPEWAWLWGNLRFALDPQPWPSEFSGMCLQPFFAQFVGSWASALRCNQYGPGTTDGNINGSNYSKGWVFDNSPRSIAGRDYWPHWTVAVGWDHRGLWAAPPLLRIINLWQDDGRMGALQYHDGLKYYQWQNDVAAYGPAPDDNRIANQTRNAVVTNAGDGGELKIYAQGQLVYTHATAGRTMTRFRLLYLNSDYNRKETECITGSIGPLLLADRVWTAAEVAQWSADPWGFIAPASRPLGPFYSPLTCDARSRPAVSFDKRSQPAVKTDGRSRPAVTGDARSQPAVITDGRSRPAVKTDVTNRGAD